MHRWCLLHRSKVEVGGAAFVALSLLGIRYNSGIVMQMDEDGCECVCVGGRGRLAVTLGDISIFSLNGI